MTKKGDIPSINKLVDICNLVSIRYQLPVATFDLRAIRSLIRVQFASGEETFNPLGVEGLETPEFGEVIFIDEDGLVVARRWCWRQSVESAVDFETRDVIITVEAQHAGGRAAVESALNDLNNLLEAYTGGVRKSAIVDSDHASFA